MIVRDLAGKTFGKLTVLRHAGFVNEKHKRSTVWLCKCECGNEATKKTTYLTSKYKNKSCGCWSLVVDLTGRRFGRLIVLRRNGVLYNCVAWLCQCDCGNTTTLSSSTLGYGGTKSCGCLGIESRIKHGMSKSPEYALLCHARRRAKANGMEFSLTLDDIKIPTHCPVLGIELKHTNKTTPNSPSVDRIDNTKGYTSDNIAIISYRANGLKSNMSLDIMEKIEAYIIQHVGV